MMQVDEFKYIECFVNNKSTEKLEGKNKVMS